MCVLPYYIVVLSSTVIDRLASCYFSATSSCICIAFWLYMHFLHDCACILTCCLCGKLDSVHNFSHRIAPHTRTWKCWEIFKFGLSVTSACRTWCIYSIISNLFDDFPSIVLSKKKINLNIRQSKLIQPTRLYSATWTSWEMWYSVTNIETISAKSVMNTINWIKRVE